MMKLGFIGASRTATVLANYWRQYPSIEIVGFYSRNLASSQESAAITASRAFTDLKELIKNSQIIFIGVNDENIAAYAQLVAKDYPDLIHNITFCHFSGALSSDVLKDAGFNNYVSLHPMFSFPTKTLVISGAGVNNCQFVLEGNHLEPLTKLLTISNNPYCIIDSKHKLSYHLACFLASSGVLATYAWAERLLKNTGTKGLDLSNLMHGVLENFKRGERSTRISTALTGPLVRGDYTILQQHMTLMNQEETIAFQHLLQELMPYVDNKPQADLR